MLSQVRQGLVRSFLGALHTDIIPWRQCGNMPRPVSLQVGREFRGANALSLSYTAVQKGYQDPRWITSKQAVEQGWHIRPGEKPERVEFWNYFDRQTRKDLSQDEVNRIRSLDPARMKDIRLAALTYAVFNAEQVEGPEPVRPERPADLGLLKRSRDLFLANLGVEFREGGDRAAYLPGTDSIVMPRAVHFANDGAYVTALLREASHATGHFSRLDRPALAVHHTSEYAKETLTVDLAAALTTQALGLRIAEPEEPMDPHHSNAWISDLEQDPGALFAAIRDAEKITDYLAERGRLLTLGRAAEPYSREDVRETQQEEEPGWEP